MPPGGRRDTQHLQKAKIRCTHLVERRQAAASGGGWPHTTKPLQRFLWSTEVSDGAPGAIRTPAQVHGWWAAWDNSRVRRGGGQRDVQPCGAVRGLVG